MPITTEEGRCQNCGAMLHSHAKLIELHHGEQVKHQLICLGCEDTYIAHSKRHYQTDRVDMVCWL